MKAEITFSQLWYNKSLHNFFFRSQSMNTLVELIDKAEQSTDSILNTIEDYANSCGLSLDEIEEMFYEYSVEELANEFGIELMNDEEDEEDE